MGLYREDMDRILTGGCQVDGCDCKDGEFFLHARCHPDAGTWAKYSRGLLTVICKECRQLVVEVEVASRPDHTDTTERRPL